jgi:hypothetical protein
LPQRRDDADFGFARVDEAERVQEAKEVEDVKEVEEKTCAVVSTA